MCMYRLHISKVVISLHAYCTCKLHPIKAYLKSYSCTNSIIRSQSFWRCFVTCVFQVIINYLLWTWHHIYIKVYGNLFHLCHILCYHLYFVYWFTNSPILLIHDNLFSLPFDFNHTVLYLKVCLQNTSQW